MSADILILGKGFIGERLQEFLKCDISSKMIYSFKDAESLVKQYSPRVLINCIGYTGARNVDDCELDIDNTLIANTFLPITLAEVALRNSIKLVHISSGCIYHYDYAHQKPITEEDTADFFELFYSRSKIYSERALMALFSKYNVLITRIRIPLDNRPHPKNVLNKLISYKRLIDIPNSVTYIPDFLSALKHLISIDAKGLYNVVNSGGLYYPKLMDVYKKYVPDFSYEVIKYESLKLVRSNLILSTKKLEDSGFKVRHVDDILEECVKEYVGRSTSASLGRKT